MEYKLGHGNRFPIIGEKFFLGIELYQNRYRFPPVSLNRVNGNVRVFYRIRSSAVIPKEFAPGQVWKVEVTNLRARQKKIAEDWRSFMWVTVDLLGLYEKRRSYFEIHSKKWVTMKLIESGGFEIVEEIPARVEFKLYSYIFDELDGSPRFQAGYFAEVIKLETERVIARFEPKAKIGAITGEPEYPLLPEDGAKLYPPDVMKFRWSIFPVSINV